MAAVFHDKVVSGAGEDGIGIGLAGIDYGQVEGTEAKIGRYLALHFALEPGAAKNHGRLPGEKLQLGLGMAHPQSAELEIVLGRALDEG